MRTRKTAITFKTVIAPSFAHCFSCKTPLYGVRAWRWRDRDGSYGYGCARTCMFTHHEITAASAA